MKYRKKPVVIDAVQWTGKNHREMFDFLTENTFKEESMTVDGDHFYIDYNKVEGGLVIKTSEGDMNVSIGDYIIKEPFDKERMYYPCKEDIFHQTYERVEDSIVSPSKPFSFWGDGNGTITVPCNTELVPFNTICGCTTCGCTMGNTRVDPRIISFTSNTLTTNSDEAQEP